MLDTIFDDGYAHEMFDLISTLYIRNSYFIVW